MCSLDERLFFNIKKIISYTQDSQNAHRRFKNETQRQEFMSKAEKLLLLTLHLKFHFDIKPQVQQSLQ